jgi:hypothetical protein
LPGLSCGAAGLLGSSAQELTGFPRLLGDFTTPLLHFTSALTHVPSCFLPLANILCFFPVLLGTPAELLVGLPEVLCLTP